ncbi:PTS transporter subunit EIIC [Streptomyces sp. OE57]|uniref:PTS transporter subunit EIIC n=1 Tax=Streptomyces lacaronensis TaxID=3379885 RepID=UPI0039B726C6
MIDTEKAREIVHSVGGAENVRELIHCVTRLRFNLVDNDLADRDRLGAIDGVQGVVSRGGQLQLVIGQGGVEEYYREVSAVLAAGTDDGLDARPDARATAAAPGTPPTDAKRPRRINLRRWFDALLETLSSIFAPIIPAIVGCGMIMGILFSMQTLGWVDPKSSAYQLLYTFSNAAFYFLPVILAFSCAQRFGAHPYVAAVLGAILIHPNFVALVNKGAGTVDLGLIHIGLRDYSSSIVPIILSVYFMSWVEKGLRRIVPKMIALIVVPTVSLLVSAFVALWILAPLGGTAGDFVAQGIYDLYTRFGFLGGIVLGALYPFILSTGMQVALTPIILSNLKTADHDFIYPVIACSNAAMAAAAIYVFIRSRDKELKQVAGSTSISAFIGVTEPVFFGIVIRFKKVLWAVMTGGAVGGGIMGALQVTYGGFGFVPFGTIILAFGSTFVFYMIGVGVSMLVTVAILHVGGYESRAKPAARVNEDASANVSKATVSAPRSADSSVPGRDRTSAG